MIIPAEFENSMTAVWKQDQRNEELGGKISVFCDMNMKRAPLSMN
jgi:hypothetical protein